MKIKKIILALFLIVLLSVVIIDSCYGALVGEGLDAANIGDTTSDFDEATDTGSSFTKLATNFAEAAIGAVRIVTATIAVVLLLTLCIKYMIAGAGERADIKKHAIVYVTGAFVMFGASGILTIIEKMADQVKSS